MSFAHPSANYSDLLFGYLRSQYRTLGSAWNYSMSDIFFSRATKGTRVEIAEISAGESEHNSLERIYYIFSYELRGFHYWNVVTETEGKNIFIDTLGSGGSICNINECQPESNHCHVGYR